MTDHIEWRDGHPVRVLDDQSPPAERHDVLRGNFAMVRYTDRHDMDETYLVLCGLSPINRKLVFRVDWQIGTDIPVQLWLTQDSLGMAREAHEE